MLYILKSLPSFKSGFKYNEPVPCMVVVSTNSPTIKEPLIDWLPLNWFEPVVAKDDVFIDWDEVINPKLEIWDEPLIKDGTFVKLP